MAIRSVLGDLRSELPVLHPHPYPRLAPAVREPQLDVGRCVRVDLGRVARARGIRHEREPAVRESDRRPPAGRRVRLRRGRCRSSRGRCGRAAVITMRSGRRGRRRARCRARADNTVPVRGGRTSGGRGRERGLRRGRGRNTGRGGRRRLRGRRYRRRRVALDVRRARSSGPAQPLHRRTRPRARRAPTSTPPVGVERERGATRAASSRASAPASSSNSDGASPRNPRASVVVARVVVEVVAHDGVPSNAPRSVCARGVEVVLHGPVGEIHRLRDADGRRGLRRRRARRRCVAAAGAGRGARRAPRVAAGPDVVVTACASRRSTAARPRVVLRKWSRIRLTATWRTQPGGSSRRETRRQRA